MKDKNEEFIIAISNYLNELEEEYRGCNGDKATIKFYLIDEIQEVFHNKYNEIVLGLPAEKA
jgi:hypothetical protein